MKCKVSIEALDDIDKLWFYTFRNWSINQADKYQDLIFDEIEYLSENPESAENYKNIIKDYRCSRVKSHLIFYRWLDESDTIEIIRVLHQRMDIESKLED